MVAISFKGEVVVKPWNAFGVFAMLVSSLILLSSLWAQDPPQPAPIGVVHDWTEHQIVYHRAALLKNPSLLEREPRIANREIARWKSVHPWVFGNASSSMGGTRKPDRDWNFDLGGGTARLAVNTFPSKFSLDPGSQPDCLNDYVVFGLNRGSMTNGQANLIGFNNLYSSSSGSPFCGTAKPTILFAYNASTNSGRISTSPVLSLDGKKIAFVETNATSSTFHVLTWTAGAGMGVVNKAANPGAAMTSLTYSAGLNTRSSPWVDYNTDVAYVGANDGILYKITGVFKGTPTLAGSPWPISLSPGTSLSSPVLDKNLGRVLVGNQQGTFFSVNTTTGVVKSLVVGVSAGTNPGILAPPIVDVSNGTSFAVSSNDGTSGVLVQINSATMTVMAKARIGVASKSHTPVNLFQPAFSDAYFDNPSTGVARLCGTAAANTTPWQYSFGFTLTGGVYVMKTIPNFSAPLTTSIDSRCTGWTEFFNRNAGVNGTDFFFFGLTTECTGTGTSGCVVMRTGDDLFVPLTFDVAGGPSGIVVDNDSTAQQASSLYFTGFTGPPNTAYKVTQNGLQ